MGLLFAHGGSTFFRIMDVADEGWLCMMLVHPRGIAAYEDIHDVVSVDTTYVVNKYKLSLGTNVSA